MTGGASLASTDSLQQEWSVADGLASAVVVNDEYEVMLERTDEADTTTPPAQETKSDAALSTQKSTKTFPRRRKTARQQAEEPAAVDVEEAGVGVVRREGDCLTWSEISMTVKAKGRKEKGLEKVILDSVYGKVTPGEVTAIMGTSGKC